MDSDAISGIVFLCCVFASAIATIWMRRRKLVSIVDYQAGVRFDGAGSKVLPAGLYLSNPNSAPISVVDLRPRQFLFEGGAYEDASGSSVVMSVAGEFLVCNPEFAVTKFKNLFEETLTMIREGLRTEASRLILAADAGARGQLTSRLTAELNRQLRPRGIEVRALEITELSIQRASHREVALAN